MQSDDQDGNFAFFDFGMKVLAVVRLQLTSGIDEQIQHIKYVLGVGMGYSRKVLVGGELLAKW